MSEKQESKMVFVVISFVVLAAMLLVGMMTRIVYTVSPTTYEDKYTRTISYTHYKVHEGEDYNYRNYTDLSINGIYNLLILVNDTDAHMVIGVTNEVEATYTLYESCNIFVNGTRLYYANRNRAGNHSDNNGIILFENPVYNDCSKIIGTNRFGSGRSFGGGDRDSQEMILNSSTNYILRVANNATGANNLINFNLDWYVENE